MADANVALVSPSNTAAAGPLMMCNVKKLFSREATTAAVHILKGEAVEATDEVVFMAFASKLTQF